ncbi:hypothetical protein Zmor_023361 [Zophobas morio]|uniref:Reverse transcriptase domain-containing protein n=1 Tax=Zophobas morio TaxID=2755281 RepID=A0AA38HYL5_9CUCU|nr:hypothetical protein Zmor_023361 [Zophobas morio]
MPSIDWSATSYQAHDISSQLLIDMINNSHVNQIVSQPTRYRLNQQPSLLDLILTSDDSSLTDLMYLSPFGKSDHVTLKINLQLCYVLRQRVDTLSKLVTKYKAVNDDLSNVDWTKLFSNSSVITNWESFKNILGDIVGKHSSIVKVSRSSVKPWISGSLLKLVRKKRSLWRAFKRTSSAADYQAHRAFSNKLSNKIREARVEYEKRIAESKDPKRLFKHIRANISGPVKIPQLKDATGRLLNDCKVIANIFAENFSRNFTVEPDAKIADIPFEPNSVHMDEIQFTPETVLKLLQKLKTTKSPGPDYITAKVLKECATSLCEPISFLFTQSFNSGTLPPDWLTAFVKPIFKKGDKFCPDNYRPISLTSVVVKIMETVVYDSTFKFLLDNKIIPVEQHGFVPGKSVVTNLLCCLSNWTRNFDLDIPTDIIYMDFSRAFDRVPKRRLLHKLHYFGIRGNLLRWIDAFLSNRSFTVKVGDACSSITRVLSGVPQGSVLGPLLFTVYTADLGVRLKSPFAMLADDLKIYKSANDHLVLCRDLLTVYTWSNEWLLPLNVDKCKVLSVGANNPRHLYCINNLELRRYESCTDLGVLVTSTLSWSDHISQVTRKANKVLYLISKVFTKTDPLTFSKLFKTYLRPILEFANAVWAPIFQRDKDLLESLQRRATRVPYGYHRPQYHQRLSIMQLPLLSNRRVRGDVITVYNALTDDNSPIKHIFPLNTDGRTRGHSYKLLKDRFRTSVRQFFIVNRVFNAWNSLPAEVVQSTSTATFKMKYDNHIDENLNSS